LVLPQDGQMFYSAKYDRTKVPTKQLHYCILNENPNVWTDSALYSTV